MRRPVAALLVAAALVVGPAASATAQAPGCDVESATLTWGFKESFRAYIDGSIANGEWTVADGATYDTPAFGFPSVSGRLDPSGSVGFAGSVRFTGHGGILDTTIANPVVVLRAQGDSLLLLDVSGPTMAGDQVAVTETPFVTIDLTGQDLAPVDGIITIEDAPTTLTADGETAFPNYPEGEAFDPISATFDIGDCALTGQPLGDDAAGDSGIPPAVIGIAAAVVAVALAVLGALLIRRRILGA